MDAIIRERILKQALADHGWKSDEAGIDEVERLRRPGCSFFTVWHTVRPVSYQTNYALIGGNRVLGTGDGNMVAQILDKCSEGAPAEWWAEIITRFHADLGGGVVLRDERTRPDIVRKLVEAGETFARPAIDIKESAITFLLLNPETYVLYRIRATWRPGSSVAIVKTRVLPAAA